MARKKKKELFSPDWAELPIWVKWVAIDSTGYIYGYEGKPYVPMMSTVWALRKKEQYLGKIGIIALGQISVPAGTDIKKLLWERPESPL